MDGLLIRELEEAAALGDGHLIPVDQGADAKKATMSQVATYIANKNIGSIFGLPVASVFYNPSTSASDVRGCVRGDNGGYYETASTTIPDLYVYIKAHSELCKTKSEYDALYTLNGFVDYYVIDEVEGSLRLPKYTKLTVKETMKWADRVSFVNNTAAPFDCIAFVGIPQLDKMHYVYLTPKDGEEFQLTHNGYSNDGPDSISVRLNTGDKLRANVTSELNGWWVPIVCQTLNLIPWIVAQHQETPEGEIALLSIKTAPSGSFAVGSKYYNSSDGLIYTAITADTWTGATTAAPSFSVAYAFNGNLYLWNGAGLIQRPAGGGSGGGTAATTPFAPTATISSDNVQDAIKEVDANKMNADFSNTSMVRWPVEVSAKSSMPNWYTVYNDGWCEQGGPLVLGTYAYTFPKEFASVNSVGGLIAQAYTNNSQGATNEGAQLIKAMPTKAGFTLTPAFNSSYYYGGKWRAEGYIN